MKTRIRYRNARVSVELKKAGLCQACKAKGCTEMHHYFYAYSSSEVRAAPALALDNTIELCYKCHRIADALRKLLKDPSRSLAVVDSVMLKMRGDVHAK
jgi:hypothetical protein